ncbi:MAG: hypothetical protein U0T81_04255 [Saprospiraceae bacterium]
MTSKLKGIKVFVDSGLASRNDLVNASRDNDFTGIIQHSGPPARQIPGETDVVLLRHPDTGLNKTNQRRKKQV